MGRLLCRSFAAITTAALALGASAQNTVPATPIAAPARSQDAIKPKTASLVVGHHAPPIKVESFLKGGPITQFEKGKIYVVEFWATWCGPCIASIPHLSELQREYRDKGVTICSVNIWEGKPYDDKTIDKVKAFVAARDAEMDYVVAYDGQAKFMDETWMRAAGRNGIPAAFMVDKTGTIAWIGHPSELDLVLDAAVNGKWDHATGPQKIKEARQAVKSAAEAYKDGLAAGDAAWEKAALAHPKLVENSPIMRYRAMLANQHYKEGFALARKLLDKFIATKDGDQIMGLVGPMQAADFPAEHIDKELVLRATEANVKMQDPTQPGTFMMQASAFYLVGDLPAAEAAAAKAVELAPAEMKGRYQKGLKQMADQAAARAAGQTGGAANVGGGAAAQQGGAASKPAP